MASVEAGEPPDRRLSFRMGVHLGEVIASDGDLYGDAINMAARLEAMAEPDQIFASQAVVDQVRRKVAVGFVDLGEQFFKNMEDPVRTYRIAVGEMAAIPGFGAAGQFSDCPAEPALIAILSFQDLGAACPKNASPMVFAWGSRQCWSRCRGCFWSTRRLCNSLRTEKLRRPRRASGLMWNM